jgi:hypothetical protein
MTALLPRSRADSPGWRVVDANDVLPPVIGQALVDESRQEVRVGDLHEVSSVRTGMMTYAREGSATGSSYAMGTVSRIDGVAVGDTSSERYSSMIGSAGVQPSRSILSSAAL